MPSNIVIGSGPAGIACAKALLDRGAKVTLLDPGQDLEPERRSLVDRLGSVEPNQWSAADLASLKNPSRPNFKGLPQKLVYGSDYSFRWLDPKHTLQQVGTDTLASHAVGGLSNAWGANLIPLQDIDHAAWPVPSAEIAQSYRSALSFVPVSEGPDDLSSFYPLYSTSGFQLPIGRQAQFVFDRLQSQKSQLNQAGIHFGRSRLAVWPKGQRDGKPCRQCQLCLFGCPYELIYSSAHTFREIASNPNFQYCKGVIAERFEERNGQVSVSLRDISNKTTSEIVGDRLFIGAGAIGTGALVLNSSGTPSRSLTIQDSRYFLVPLLLDKSISGVCREPLTSLSQLMLHMTHPALGSTTGHLLLYTYNELFDQLFRKLTWFIPLAGNMLREYGLGRFVVFQGYLHSDHSPAIELTVESPAAGSETSKIVLTGVKLERGLTEIQSMLKQLTKFQAALGGRLLTPLLQTSRPGKSYHLGGSLPMRQNPQEFETDSFGRLYGHQRVHIVDASVLPSIPASNTTFAVIANAYRIGQASEHCQ